MQRVANSAVVLAAFLLSACAASAQNGRSATTTPYPITVVVRNHADYQIMQRVKVQISTNAGIPIDTYFTGSDGKVISQALAPGEYVVTIEVEGFKPFRAEVEIVDYPGPRLNADLIPADAEKPPPQAQGEVVSARELGLPQPAQEAMQKGRDELFQKHDPAAALVYFQKVLVMAPDFYEANYFSGVALFEKGQAKEAEEAFHAALDMSFNQFPDADFGLAALLSAAGRFKEAEQFAHAGLTQQPDSWRGEFEMARLLLGLNRLPEAEQHGLAAKKLNPGYSRLYLLLANIHVKLNNNAAVVDDLGTFLKLEPNGPYTAQAQALKTKTEQALTHPASLPTDHH